FSGIDLTRSNVHAIAIVREVGTDIRSIVMVDEPGVVATKNVPIHSRIDITVVKQRLAKEGWLRPYHRRIEIEIKARSESPDRGTLGDRLDGKQPQSMDWAAIDPRSDQQH